MQDRGVDVGDVMPVLDGVEADLVGGAVDDAPLDAAAGQPGAEALRVVVAAVGLGARRPAELGAPDDDRLVEHPAPLEVPQQAGDRQVDLGRELAVVGQDAGVGVPGAAAAAAVEDLDEPHAALDQAAGGQAEPAERTRRVAIQAVECLRRRPLLVQLEGLGHGGLHAEGQLIGLDPRPQRRVVGIVDARQAIEPAQQAELGDLLLGGSCPSPARRTAAAPCRRG